MTLFLLLGLSIGWESHATWGASDENASPDNPEEGEEHADLSLFWDVWSLVKENYVNIENVEEQNQIYGAIAGMVEALGDPYSVFMNPEESEQFESSLDGELQGIGAELTIEDGRLVIVAPLKDSPAEEAGLLPGDHIYLVNGEPTSEMTLWEAIMNIRGEPDTQVTLTLLREGVEEPIEITITRQEIQVPSVELTYHKEEGKTWAHLAIYQFGDDTYNEFEAAVQDLLLNNIDGLVLDLRMNGGGYLDISVEMLSEFFADERTGVIVKRRNATDEYIKTTGGGRLTELPLVVLVDEGSASAAEILAGALQDYKRGLLMGEQSFGKGSVQELKSLSDGSSLRLTIAKWYTPNERSIDDTGITPDIQVSMEPSAIDTESDIQLNAAFQYLLDLK